MVAKRVKTRAPPRLRSSDRDSVIHAVRLLSGFIVDLGTAADTWRRTSQIVADAGGIRTLGAIAYTRMSLSHLILNLAKLIEFYQRFGSMMPPEVRDRWKVIIRELERRPVTEFRNTVIGHIWDRKRNRPLFDSEVDACIDQIANNDPANFVEWVVGHDDDSRGVSIVGLGEQTRNLLRDANKITNAEANR